MEQFILVLVVITTCAVCQGKMLTFPQETNTAHVRLTSRERCTAITVCLRALQVLLSSLRGCWQVRSNNVPRTAQQSLMARTTPSTPGTVSAPRLHPQLLALYLLHFDGQDYTLNSWHCICSTLASEGLDSCGCTEKQAPGNSSNLKPSKKNIILGQEQVKFGWLFARQQSFIGLLTDVHMWDNMLSPCEIQRFFTNLRRNHILFSLATLIDDAFVIFKRTDRISTKPWLF
ncbi:serum amyloid P-component-like [Salvelinus alpinus]